MRFIHTADVHLGKTYRNASGEAERYRDFFTCLSAIVADAIREQVDAVLIAGDLFHVGQILPRTFARTSAVLAPLAEAGIPCIAVEGNHDWIHRRNNISWMEALAHMGLIRLLRPARTEDGGYRFDPVDEDTGIGGRLRIGDTHIYGVGYIGAQAGRHVERICDAVSTDNNLLLFHVGIWSYSPVEIGNMKPEEAFPLAERFGYVALGHGHKPYIVETPDGLPFAWNPGSPERVNFGEQAYDKGYYLVQQEDGVFTAEFRPTDPRPMFAVTLDLDGIEHPEAALDKIRRETKILNQGDSRRPLVELKLTGRVPFHPFELGRERLRAALEESLNPLHVEIRNRLTLHTAPSRKEEEPQSLADIERTVLKELIGAGSDYQGREEELVRLALAMRDAVQSGKADGEELLDLLERGTE